VKFHHRVGHAGDQTRPQAVAQLVGGVLEAERQEQEQHPDLDHEADEGGTDVERRESSLADGQSGQQVERDGRHPEAAGQAGQHGEDQRHGADLDERPGRVGSGGGEDGHDTRRVRSWSRPSGVPTATTTSPSAKP
jgi:hypothetical protein